MNEEYIATHEIIKRYLNGKLTPEETVEFEEYILDKPELLEQIELDSVLVKTLPDVDLAKFKDPKENTTHASHTIEKSHWWTPLFSHLTAIAASSALVAVLYFESPTTAPISDNFSPQVVYLETYRSTDEIHGVSFTDEEVFKVMVIDVPPDTTNRYTLDIIDANDELNMTKILSVNDNSEISFLLKKSAIQSGTYKVKLGGGNYSSTFKVRIKHE
jgi:hypothetical protein